MRKLMTTRPARPEWLAELYRGIVHSFLLLIFLLIMPLRAEWDIEKLAGSFNDYLAYVIPENEAPAFADFYWEQLKNSYAQRTRKAQLHNYHELTDLGSIAVQVQHPAVAMQIAQEPRYIQRKIYARFGAYERFCKERAQEHTGIISAIKHGIASVKQSLQQLFA
jgi:hypothetical protein